MLIYLKKEARAQFGGFGPGRWCEEVPYRELPDDDFPVELELTEKEEIALGDEMFDPALVPNIYDIIERLPEY